MRIQDTYLIFLIIAYNSSAYALDEVDKFLEAAKICGSSEHHRNVKQLCSEPIYSKAVLVDKKYLFNAANLDSFEQLKELETAASLARAKIFTCELMDVEKYSNCINAALDEANLYADTKFSTIKDLDVSNISTAENYSNVKVNIAKVLKIKLDDLETCRIQNANKLDDNISPAADIASGIQAKCNYIAHDFYDYFLKLTDPRSMYDIFQSYTLDWQTFQKLVNEGVELHYGQQATTTLVLEQRAIRKEQNQKQQNEQNLKKNIKPKVTKRIIS